MTAQSYMTMFVRREPAKDGTKGKMDVCLYHEVSPGKPSSIPCARYPWHYADIPTRRNKYVRFNCNKYKIRWLDHMGNPE